MTDVDIVAPVRTCIVSVTFKSWTILGQITWNLLNKSQSMYSTIYFGFFLEMAFAAFENGTDLSNLTDTSVSTFPSDEKSLKNFIRRMKENEFVLEQVVQSMGIGKGSWEHGIKLIKYREKRLRFEIELTRQYEKREEIIVFEKSVLINEDCIRAIITDLEAMQKREKRMCYEIERLKCSESQIEGGIQFMKHCMERGEFSLTPVPVDLQNLDFLNSQQQEQRRNKLVKSEMKLGEHRRETKIREEKLEEHRVHIKERQMELEDLRLKVEQEQRKISYKAQRAEYQKRLAEYRAQREEYEKLLSNTKPESLPDAPQLKKRLPSLLCCILRSNYSIKSEESSDSLYSFEDGGQSDSLLFISEPLCILSISAYEGVHAFIEQPKYDILISSFHPNGSSIERIRTALPPCYSTHLKDCLSTTNIKTSLDNTGTAVIAIIDKEYELNEICQADLIYTFKQQLPLVLLISDREFTPQKNWLTVVWNAFNTQKVFLDAPEFEENIRNALSCAQWNLSESLETSEASQSGSDERFNRFIGDFHQWTVAYHNPAQVSQNYRELIRDPLRMTTDKKLQDFYFKYARVYFSEDSSLIQLFQEGATGNDIRHFVQAYTTNGPFYTTLNRHLAANVLFYFDSTLYDTVDYQLVKCLIDFVALFIYREELRRYLFAGTVFRGMMVTAADLDKYVVGSRLMNTTFLSTSSDRSVAEMFFGENKEDLAVLCTFIVRKNNGRRTAISIKEMSNFLVENEVLLMPFSPFYVRSVRPSVGSAGPIEITLVEDDCDNVEDNEQ